ncbi:hypothetical protein [uncultured Ruegeria sp.]|uniref:hypothetical protein n=1 Tax=uncultured Ruegeria sp. TaxID=259304 RepID=UPI00261A3B0A|nr:hypothetical protein [uncultured Ruegeria sp.]
MNTSIQANLRCSTAYNPNLNTLGKTVGWANPKFAECRGSAMMDANLFPIGKVSRQIALIGCETDVSGNAPPKDKVLVSIVQVVVSAEQFIGMSNFPMVPNRGDGPNTEAVCMKVKESRFHPRGYSMWRN